ncbi:MAG: DUF3048 domain-containing protein [Patescibacteria group bacterium]|jgi:hypothetical protein
MKKIVILCIPIYFVIMGVSFVLFSGMLGGAQTKTQTTNTNTPTEGDSGPKTEECPLNGAYYSVQQRQLWEKRRPLGVMVENSTDARPQSGLSKADVVFEAVAEGGITRFLSVFYCQTSPIVGPVRSARVYFLDFIGGFGESPLYAHVGGANTPGPANALGQIEDMDWVGYNDINQFSVGYPVFWRDYERLPGVATEHTMYTDTSKLWKTAASRDLTNVDEEGVSWDKTFVPWVFKEESPLEKRPATASVAFGFWEDYRQFNVVWTYNKTTNTYTRTNGGKKHLDKATNKQLQAKTIVIVYMDEGVADDGYDQGQHLLYGTKGTGDAVILQDGTVTKGSWAKKDRFTQIRFYDASDEEVKFNRGTIWVEVLPTGNKVVYK